MAKSPAPPSTKPKHRSNVYTILALASILILITGVVLLYMTNVKMTGWEQPENGQNPYFLTKDPDKK